MRSIVRVLAGLAGAVVLSGTALAQGMPWVSLGRADLAACMDTIKEFKTRWLSSIAVQRDQTCNRGDRAGCQTYGDWYNGLVTTAPVDFMMNAPADCSGCGAKMMDEYASMRFTDTVPKKVKQAGGAPPISPPLRRDFNDGVAYMDVVYHCLSSAWVEKLFASGQTLDGVSISAAEAGTLGVTTASFDKMVSDLTRKYARPAPAPVPGNTVAKTKPAPTVSPGAKLRAAVRECGDNDAAAKKRITACTNAIGGGAKDYDLVLAYWARSVMRLQQGDAQGAIADADAAAKIEPEDYSVQNARCWPRAVINSQLDVARIACDAAIRLAPGEASVRDSRGMVGLRQQRWQDAWKDYDDAVRISPDFASAIYGRGLAAFGLGRDADGQKDVNRAVQLDPGIDDEYTGYGLTPGSVSGNSGGRINSLKSQRN